MESKEEKNNAPWLSVPQFGDWDQKGQVPDYSMDFTQIREMRKRHKRDASRASIGNQEELITATTATDVVTKANTDHQQHKCHEAHDPPTARRSIFSYFNCCVKA